MAGTTHKSYKEVVVKSWKDLLEWEENRCTNSSEKHRWAFRGQTSHDFPQTSLERLCKSFKISESDIEDLEIKLIRDFARRYHLYANSAPPVPGNTLEWLALLRHYGSPTRLLDFTYSFFIATFFALEEAEKEASVWALNITELEKETLKFFHQYSSEANRLTQYLKQRDGESYRKLFMRSKPKRFVCLANPIRLNERLTIQQGLFLAPGDVTTTFKENFFSIPNIDGHITQIRIDFAARREILKKLHQMGINTASLYPGLEGFARSLKTTSLILTDLEKVSLNSLKDL